MKTTQEQIAVMQAYADGKKIETCYAHSCDKPYWTIIPHPLWDWSSYDYRIKLETKIVPYESDEEFIAAMKEHGLYVSHDGKFDIPLSIYMNGINLPILRIGGSVEHRFFTYKDLVTHTWVDGSPVGKEVME